MATLTDGTYMPAEVMKKKVLELYAEIGNVAKACDQLGLVRRTFYHWKAQDKEFAAQLKIAEELALGVLEDEAHRRAVAGVEKPVYQGGKKVGTVNEYSDTLLIVLLKARAPHRYKERFSGELTGADGKPLLSEMKMLHVHSQQPLAQSEEEVMKQIAGETGDYIDYEETPPPTDDLDMLL